VATISEKFAELQALGIAPTPAPTIVELPVLNADLTPTGGSFFSFIGSPGPVTIYWHLSFGAHEVYGAILNAYLAQGGPIGSLGFPLTGEYDDVVGQQVVGRVNEFQNGSISWDSATNTTSTFITGPVTIGPSFEQMAGIDVSQFQATIDWPKIAANGTTEGEVISFAYIRATHDDAGKDTRFDENWTKSAGLLPRGAYHFFRAHRTPDDTRPQLDFIVNTLQAAGPGELPPMIDVESLPPGITVLQAEQSLQFFLSLLEQAFGVRPIIYTYPHFWKHQMANSTAFANYKLWIANYGPKTAEGGFRPRMTRPVIPGGWTDFAIWQHAVKSGVHGISGLVDRDQLLVPLGVSLADYLRL
jgi:lysozyme